MGKTTTVKKGTNPLVAIMIFIFCLLLLAGVVFLLKTLYPEAFSNLFGKPDDALVKENEELKDQLNASNTELGETKAALFDEKAKNIAWGLGLGIFLAVLALLFFYFYLYLPRQQGLNVEQAENWANPRSRNRYGFPLDRWPMIKFTTRTVERVKHKAGSADNELMYFIEMEFIGLGEDNLYVHGMRPDLNRVVTVAILNKSYLFRQQWYPWHRIEQAMRLAHEAELWGFSLQKTKLEEDILAALEGSRNVQDVKKEFTAEEVESA